MNQVTQTETNVTPEVTTTTFQVLPAAEKPLAVQDAMKDADAYRMQASKDWQNFYVGGRNATKALVQQVYSLYYAVMHSDTAPTVLARMQAKIPEKKIYANTTNSTIFIRYVFADFDDRQVHVYHTAMDVAFAKKVEPSGFTTWVESHKNGFEGIRAAAAQKDNADGKKLKASSGMSFALGAVTVETIAATDFDEDETCRIFVAVPNGDGTAALKDMLLKPEEVETVLATYARAVAARNKAKSKGRKKLTDVQKKARFDLKGQQANQETLLDNLRADMSVATKAGKLGDVERLEGEIDMVKVKIVGIKAQLKAISGGTGE